MQKTVNILRKLRKKKFTKIDNYKNSFIKIIDFCLIKERVKRWIDTNWDHNVILSKRDDKLADAITNITGQNVFLLDNNATTEIMAEYLLNICNNVLFIEEENDIVCIKIKLWETPTSFAEVEQR